MTNDFILNVIHRAVPTMIKIVVISDIDIEYYFEGEKYPSTWTAFIPHSKTRRACEVARFLPVGEYFLGGE